MFETVASVLVRFLVCFLIGSIPFAVLSMLGSGIDIRRVGSGNPGFNNVLRVSSRRAVLALIGDMGKGYFAVWLVLRGWPATAAQLGSHAWLAGSVATAWFYAFGAVLGHCFSPFLKFNGGKGIATSGGAMLVLHPIWAVVALAYFTAARITGGKLKWREAGTIASLTTWVLFPLLMFLFVGPQDAICSAVMLVFLVWRHKRNVQSLVFGPSRDVPGPLPATTGPEGCENVPLPPQLTADDGQLTTDN